VPVVTPTALRRRADAARRLEPVEGRHGPHLGARDPAACWPSQRGPSTFGMTDDERRCYAAYLIEGGWQQWEIVATLTPPELAA
jgi:hypothetical protein